MKNVIWASLLAASAAMIAGCHGGETAATPGAAQTMQARVVESQQQQLPVNLQSTGTVHARETAIVSAQVMGRIQQVLVREGDSVRAGQTLVVLDDAALRSQVEQAQAGVKAAQNAQAAAQTNAALAASTLDRYKQLESEKSVSPQEMDEVSQRAEAAAASLEAMRAQTDAARAQENGARTMMSIHAAGCALRRRGHSAHGRSGDDGRTRRAAYFKWIRPEHCNWTPQWMSR